MARPQYAQGNSAQYQLNRRMSFQAPIWTRWERYSCLCRESGSTHPAGSLINMLTELTWTQDVFFNVPNHEGTMHDWLLASEKQMSNWCHSKQSGIASSLTFILWASLPRKWNSYFTFCYRMEGPWHICHYNARFHQKSYCRIWENLYSIHIWINHTLHQRTPHHLPTIHKPCFIM
jgi:hypothetical protein